MSYKGTSFLDAGYFYAPYIPITRTPTVLPPFIMYLPAYFSVELQPFRDDKFEYLMAISEAVEDPNSAIVVITEFDNEKSTGVCVWCDTTYKFVLIDYNMIGLYK